MCVCVCVCVFECLLTGKDIIAWIANKMKNTAEGTILQNQTHIKRSLSSQHVILKIQTLFMASSNHSLFLFVLQRLRPVAPCWSPMATSTPCRTTRNWSCAMTAASTDFRCDEILTSSLLNKNLVSVTLQHYREGDCGEDFSELCVNNNSSLLTF